MQRLTTEDVAVMCETLVKEGLMERLPFDGEEEPRYRLTKLGEEFAKALEAVNRDEHTGEG